MTTIVNSPTPAASSNDSGGNGLMFLIGVLVLVGFMAALFYFGYPIVRNMTQQSQISVPTPQVNVEAPQAPQVVVPDKIDVNVTQPK